MSAKSYPSALAARVLPLERAPSISLIFNLGTLLHFCTHFQQPKKTPKRVHC